MLGIEQVSRTACTGTKLLENHDVRSMTLE